MSLLQIAQKLAEREVSSVELTKQYLKRIKAQDELYNSFIAVEEELALAQAQQSDQRRAKGEAYGVLDGLPYNLKDVYATKGSNSTAASHILEGWSPPYDATVYAKLKAAGGVLLGKTNTDQFTMGASSETSYYGVTRNPWDTDRVAGGSSGGPCASLAAGFSAFSIGTDTGGSIRQPAAFCGVTGLRPTYGRVSRFGEIAMASSLDQTGPITESALDAALVLEQIAGVDGLDATSSPEPVDVWSQSMLKLISQAESGQKALKGLRVGIAKEYFGQGVQAQVEQLIREAILELEKQGATLVELSLPLVEKALAAYYIIAPAEVSSNMARYDGIRYGYSVERQAEGHYSLYDIYAQSRAQGLGEEVKRRIMLGTHVLSAGYYDAYYKKAEAVREMVQKQFVEAFKAVDILAAPVSPHWAFKVGEKSGDPLSMYKEDILTVPLNIGGIPGISLPAGFVQTEGKQLPVGLQLMAGRFREDQLLNASAVYQTVTDWHLRKAYEL